MTVEFDIGEALITACHRNYSQVVKQITQDQRCTRDILNKQNILGETALMTTVAYGHTEILELLVSLPGIDFSLRNIGRKTVWLIQVIFCSIHKILSFTVILPTNHKSF